MARYTVHTPDGPKRRTIYSRSYKVVERKLAEARGDAAKGLVFDADNLKLGESRRVLGAVARRFRDWDGQVYDL